MGRAWRRSDLALRAGTQTDGGAVTSYLDRLNLRPFEKRLVWALGAGFFVVLNGWFVVPHFSDLGQAKKRRADALELMKRWQVEIDQKVKYEAGINKFIREGHEVQAEDQAKRSEER